MVVKDVICQIHRSHYSIIEKVRLSNREFAIRKTFNPLLDMESESLIKLRKRFVKEVKVQETLPMQLFVPIIYSELQSDYPWFLMPVCQKTYEQEIQFYKDRGGNISGLSDILNSLDYLHIHGLIHRDLKPQNILLHEGNWKLADFGLIKTDINESSEITSTSSNAGTQRYCAPEQVNHFKRVTHKADIYSFGAVLHDIFGTEDRIPYSKLSAKGEIGLVIEKCTEIEPEKRFKNVESLRIILLRILAEPTKTSSSSVQTNEWLSRLKQPNKWNDESLESFSFYLRRNELEQESLFFRFDESILHLFNQIDGELFVDIMIQYFEWINNKHFEFDYCDVLIGMIYVSYCISDNIELKAKAVIIASRLGSHHNRWYVMDYVLKMAGVDIDEKLATRIHIEIYTSDSSIVSYFKHCATVRGNNIDKYHPKIKEVLK